MSEYYLEKRAATDAKLRRRGLIATLEKPGVKTGDEWAPEIGKPTSSDLPLLILKQEQVTDDPDATDAAQEQAAGALVEKIMVTAMASAEVQHTPTDDDRVKIGEVWYSVKAVRPFAPGGVTVYFEVDMVT